MKENPKAIAAAEKPTVHCVPPDFEFLVGAAMKTGADKYGRFNWRVTGVKASTYYDAINRHLRAWFDGRDLDRESGLHHLAHVAACCAVVLDCDQLHILLDDRHEPIAPDQQENKMQESDYSGPCEDRGYISH